MIDKKYLYHNYITMKYFTENDKDQLEQMFGQSYLGIINGDKNSQSSVKVLDSKMNKYLDDRVEVIEQPFIRLITKFRNSFNRSK